MQDLYRRELLKQRVKMVEQSDFEIRLSNALKERNNAQVQVPKPS